MISMNEEKTIHTTAPSRESLSKIIKKIGFRCQKTKTNKKFLIEKPDIEQMRLNYLRKIQRFR